MFKFFKKRNNSKFTPKKYVIFNIDTFNIWFNDKDNQAEYSHSGIYLRLDKLSESQIEDYLVKCHGLNIGECDLIEDISNFKEEIRKDWFKKLEEKSLLIKNKYINV